MKRIILCALILFYTLTSMAQMDLERVSIDTSLSIVHWRGSYLFDFNEHYGFVKIKKGQLNLDKDGDIIGGTFDIDMSTIGNTDGKYNEMLVSHLKNPDFFDVEEHPFSKLEIKSVSKQDEATLNITAHLTIKDVTHQIEFRSTYHMQGEEMILKAHFIIDRTRWGIDYQSKGIIGSLKNDIISDAIEFDVVIVAALNRNMTVTNTGLKYNVIKEGNGPMVKVGDEVQIKETVTYRSGKLIFTTDGMKNLPVFLIGGKQAIDGLDEGVRGMQKGEVRKMVIPPHLSKRTEYPDIIHPDSTLLYTVELFEIMGTIKK